MLFCLSWAKRFDILLATAMPLGLRSIFGAKNRVWLSEIARKYRKANSTGSPFDR